MAAVGGVTDKMHIALSCGSGFVSLSGGELLPRRPLDGAALAEFGRRYALVREQSDAAAQESLRSLGQALYAWLDGAEGWLAQLRAVLTPPLVLEVTAPRQPDAAEWAVLQAPWEVLADARGFLAGDGELGYAP